MKKTKKDLEARTFSVCETFGITEERSEILNLVLRDCIDIDKNDLSIPQMYKKLIENCKTENECRYVSYLIGRLIEFNQMKHDLARHLATRE